MVATAIYRETKISELDEQSFQKREYQPKPISWTDFKSKYLSREDNFKYEWVNGYVEKTARPMNQSQYYLLDNIEEAFNRLKFEQKATGKFYDEIDTFFLDKVHRRPDSAYFDDTQRELMQNKINQIPRFVIEIISDNDMINKVFKKMQNYRAANVEVVWLIFPELKEVHVYLKDAVMICESDMICSAAPVLPELKLTVADIFRPLNFNISK